MRLKARFFGFKLCLQFVDCFAETWEKLTYFLLTVEEDLKKALSLQTLPLWEEHSFHWTVENQVSEFPEDLDSPWFLTWIFWVSTRPAWRGFYLYEKKVHESFIISFEEMQIAQTWIPESILICKTLMRWLLPHTDGILVCGRIFPLYFTYRLWCCRAEAGILIFCWFLHLDFASFVAVFESELSEKHSKF